MDKMFVNLRFERWPGIERSEFSSCINLIMCVAKLFVYISTINTRISCTCTTRKLCFSVKCLVECLPKGSRETILLLVSGLLVTR